jgi:23S rRNA-/tRNA-specific pseudouridylate synthase
MKFKVEKDGTLLEVIMEKVGYNSKTKGRKLIKAGSVHVDGNAVSIPNSDVKSGQHIAIEDRMHKPAKKQVPIPYPVLADTEKFMAVEKPAGIASISKDRKVKSALGEMIKAYKSENPEGEDLFLINKIDKRESGVLIFAKGLRARKDMEELWSQSRCRYYAIIEGTLEGEDGKLISHFVRNKIGLLKVSADKEKSREAEMHWRKMKEGSGYTLLKIEAVTDVKNQIRAQLNLMEHPVVGDERYGSAVKGYGRVGLHLFSIDLKVDDAEPVNIKTNVPRDFLNMVKEHNKKQK